MAEQKEGCSLKKVGYDILYENVQICSYNWPECMLKE